MSVRGKFIVSAGILLFLVLVTWVVRSIPEPPKLVEPNNEPRIITYEGNALSAEKDGRKQWELVAEHIAIDVDTQNAEMRKITGKFYGEDNRVVTLTSDHGTYNQTTKDIAVDGNVKVVNTDGAELTCQKLSWVAEKEMLVAEGEARVKKEDMRANGDRIESTDGFNHIKIIGSAHIEKGAKDENE